MLQRWILCVLCVFSVTFSNAEETVFVTIPQGSMMGLKMITVLHNKTYYSFKGIPFSKPMLGQHKFDPPEDPEPWEGLLDARNHREPCTQYSTILDFMEGEEDCLHLNVYTPSIYRDTCKPVMVWIYGGGYNLGQANYDYYGGDYLVEHDVVVVTFNYRVGAMGFLCTGDKHAAGNMGLKDQTYALRWVSKNIQYFGGCADQITIFGQDAGGASVQYHMVSPMSRGLFHAAISQSGSLTDYWNLNSEPKASAQKVARVLGIDTDDSKKLVEELKKTPATDIALATVKLYRIGKDIPNWNWMFLPCLETKIEGKEQFLPDHPMNMLLAGDIADVPLITGVTLNEGAFAFSGPVNLAPLYNKVNLTLREKMVVRPNMGLTEPDKISQLYNEIYQFYFGYTPLENITINQMHPVSKIGIINFLYYYNSSLVRDDFTW